MPVRQVRSQAGAAAMAGALASSNNPIDAGMAIIR
jgi:hypothetical protein